MKNTMTGAMLFMAFLAFGVVMGFRPRGPARAGAALWSVRDPTTAVIIVDHGSRKAEANDMLLSVALSYKKLSKVQIVEAAHMEMASPSIADAYQRCVAQGAKHIICHPFFLSPGRHVQEDIPSLMREASLQHPGVTYAITAPLGVQDGVVDIIAKAVDKTAG